MVLGRCLIWKLQRFCSASIAGGTANSAGKYKTDSEAASLESTTLEHSESERVRVSQPVAMYWRMGVSPPVAALACSFCEQAFRGLAASGNKQKSSSKSGLLLGAAAEGEMRTSER